MESSRFIHRSLVAGSTLATTLSNYAAEPAPPDFSDAVPQPASTLESPGPGIWQAGVGEGFRSSVHSISFDLGASYGLAHFGSTQVHDLALASLTYGLMLDGPVSDGHWYRGNWELRFELFSGAQFSPNSAWLVGLTPHLRYNFATGTRWIPCFDVGAGVTATSIGLPDLSGTFQFNLQGGGGVQWFIRDNISFGVDVRYLHISCAGINTPNLGVNTIRGMLGASFYF